MAASKTSAAFAGIWSVTGLVPFDAWQQAHHLPTLQHNAIFLSVGIVFLLIPMFFFVMGSDNPRLSWLWMFNPEERRLYGVVLQRMAVWFMAAVVWGSIWSLLLNSFK